MGFCGPAACAGSREASAPCKRTVVEEKWAVLSDLCSLWDRKQGWWEQEKAKAGKETVLRDGGRGETVGYESELP